MDQTPGVTHGGMARPDPAKIIDPENRFYVCDGHRCYSGGKISNGFLQ